LWAVTRILIDLSAGFSSIMVLISDGWPDVTTALANMEPEYSQRITDLTASLDFNHLTVYINTLHDRFPCRIIEDRYTWGQSFVVFEAAFQDRSSWVVRVAMTSLSSAPESCSAHEVLLRKKMANEAAALEIVRERTTIPVPHIIAIHTKSSTNPLGPDAPAFMVLTSIEGTHMTTLGIDMSNPDPTCGDEMKLSILTKYFYDLADVHVQLSGITYPLIGSFTIDAFGDNLFGPSIEHAMGPFTSSTAYFRALADHFDHIASAGSSHSEVDRLKKQFVAFMWRSAILTLVDTHDDHGPFPLRHGDLHVDNILVDSTGHIVGLLDWDCAATVPWEVFAVPGVDTSAFFVDVFESGKPKTENFPPRHAIFNRALKARQTSSSLPSGKSLAELHDSTAAHIGAYLALFMASMECDYRFVGRSLYKLLEWGGDIDEGFTKFLTTRESLEE
jgi:hypothetical protein